MSVSLPSFLASLFLSKLGDQILLFLVPLVVYQTTGSVAWSGLAFFAETLPRFVAFPLCGALCDRKSPLVLLRVSQLCRAGCCVAGVLGHQLWGGIGWLVALSAVSGVLTTQGLMAREVMLPHIFRGHRLQQGLAYSQAADQAGFVLGPMLAALLLNASRWEVVVGASAVLFLLADLALKLWERSSDVALPAPAEQGRWSLVSSVRTALLHVRDIPGLLRLVVLAAGVNLVVGATLASSAALVTGFYGRSTGYYAALQTVAAVATVLILLGIAHSSLSLRAMARLSYALIFAGGMATALSPNHWGYAAGFLLVIGFDKMFNIYIRSSRQKIIPAADFGKTTGVVVMLNNLTQPAAGLVIGMSSSLQETGWVILLLALLMAALGLGANLMASIARSSDRRSRPGTGPWTP